MGYRLYTVHERAAPAGADPDVVLVREGFSWPAAVFAPLWLALHGLWLASAAYLGLVLLLAGAEAALGLAEPVLAAAGLGLALLVGYLGPEAWRLSLARRGYGLTAVVGGRNRDEAERRLFVDWPADHRANFTPAARAAPF